MGLLPSMPASQGETAAVLPERVITLSLELVYHVPRVPWLLCAILDALFTILILPKGS